MLTPSYAAYLVEWAAERGFDLRGSSVGRVLVAGEPGGGEPAFRAKLEEGWGAQVTEAMGIGDIGVSLWGECEQQDGMHLGAPRIRPRRAHRPGDRRGARDGGRRHRRAGAHPSAAPGGAAASLPHPRPRRVRTSPCPCGRTGPRVRCIGRTDDMLIVRGVNVFPSAVREVVSGFAPDVSGQILVRPSAQGPKQDPPLPVSVELGARHGGRPGACGAIRERLREVLLVQTSIELVPSGTWSAASTSRSWSER